MNISGRQLVLCTAVISGFSIFISKFGVSSLNPFVFTGIKNIVVAVLLFSTIVLLGNFEKLKSLPGRDLRNLAVIGAVGGSIPFLLFFYGLKITSAAKAAFLHKTMFIYVAILAFFFLKEKLNKKQIIATVGLLAGLSLLVGVPASLDYGALLVFIAAMFWSVENIISKHVLKSVSPVIVAFGRMFFGSLIIFSILAFTGQATEMFTFNLAQLGLVLVSIAFLFGYVLTWYHGLQKIPVSEATGILVLGAAITALLDAAYSMKIALSDVAGIFLILAGIAALLVFSKSMQTQPYVMEAKA